MTRPKVMHVLTHLDFGGVESVMKMIGSSAHLSGFDHVFCAISRGGAADQYLTERGCPVYVLGVNPRIPSPRALWRLGKLMQAVRPSVVHSHGGEANFHALCVSVILRIPVRIVEEIGISAHSRLASVVFRILFRRASGLVAVSKSVANHVVSLGEIEMEKCWVMMNPPLLSDYQERDFASQGRIILGFVGRLEEEKNPRALIESVHLLRERDVHAELMLVGHGSQSHSLQQLVLDLQLPDRVTFLGFKDDPIRALQGAHLLVQPSLSEGLGLAVLEAMSSGLPVLVSPHGGTVEFVTHGENGWILHGVGPSSIADSISQIAAINKETLRNVARRGSEMAHREFSAEDYLRSLDRMYLQFLE